MWVAKVDRAQAAEGVPLAHTVHLRCAVNPHESIDVSIADPARRKPEGWAEPSAEAQAPVLSAFRCIKADNWRLYHLRCSAGI